MNWNTNAFFPFNFKLKCKPQNFAPPSGISCASEVITQGNLLKIFACLKNVDQELINRCKWLIYYDGTFMFRSGRFYVEALNHIWPFTKPASQLTSLWAFISHLKLSACQKWSKGWSAECERIKKKSKVQDWRESSSKCNKPSCWRWRNAFNFCVMYEMELNLTEEGEMDLGYLCSNSSLIIIGAKKIWKQCSLHFFFLFSIWNCICFSAH